MSPKKNNVRAFRHYQLTNVPNALRLLAEQIENGEVDANRVAIVLETSPGEDGSTDSSYKVFGEDCTPQHAAGMLEMGKLLVLGW